MSNRTYDYAALVWELAAHLPPADMIGATSYVLAKLQDEEGVDLEADIDPKDLRGARQKVLTYYGRLLQHKEYELKLSTADQGYAEALKQLVERLSALPHQYADVTG